MTFRNSVFFLALLFIFQFWVHTPNAFYFQKSRSSTYVLRRSNFDNVIHLDDSIGILHIIGQDRFRFLQGLGSNDFEGQSEGNLFPSAFLSSQGKLVHYGVCLNNRSETKILCEKASLKDFHKYLDRFIFPADKVEVHVESSRSCTLIGRSSQTLVDALIKCLQFELNAEIDSCEEKVINAKVQIVRVIAGLSKTNLKSQNPMLVHGGTILFIQGTELLSPISAIPVAPQISDSLHTDSLHTESLHTDSPHTDPLQSVADELAHGCTIVVQNERTATATTLQGETLTEPHHMSLADFVFTVLARISSDSDSARIRHENDATQDDKVLTDGASDDNTITPTEAPLRGQADGAQAAVWRDALRRVTGRPATGYEIKANYTALEAGLMQSLHFRKGCYAGNEVISKTVSTNAVRRHLCALEVLHIEDRRQDLNIPQGGQEAIEADDLVVDGSGEIVGIISTPPLSADEVRMLARPLVPFALERLAESKGMARVPEPVPVPVIAEQSSRALLRQQQQQQELVQALSKRCLAFVKTKLSVPGTRLRVARRRLRVDQAALSAGQSDAAKGSAGREQQAEGGAEGAGGYESVEVIAEVLVRSAPYLHFDPQRDSPAPPVVKQASRGRDIIIEPVLILERGTSSGPVNSSSSSPPSSSSSSLSSSAAVAAAAKTTNSHLVEARIRIEEEEAKTNQSLIESATVATSASLAGGSDASADSALQVEQMRKVKKMEEMAKKVAALQAKKKKPA